jgi:hypothetical protein
MPVTELQQQIIDRQIEFTAKLSQLAVVVGEAEAAGGEFTPNLDEAWAAYNDVGQKALDAVESLLNKLQMKLGDPG